MSENNININPKFSFCKVIHRYPKKEEYVISKKIKVIENTPVSPSFLKKILHATSYIFHKINMIFLIRSINNNKGLGSFGHIENREVSYENNNNRSCYNHIDISKLDMINQLINNSNAKFDFYSFCDYLTEVKMVENYFSLSNHHDFINPNDQDLSIIFNAIIHTRLIGLNDDDFKNIYKLIIKRYNYEKIHLNKENSFISNFSSVKKRDELISFINLLIIAENEIGILSKLDQELSDKIKNNLSIIMKEMLGSEYQEYTTYEELSMAWMNTHVYRYKQGECIEIDKGKIDVIENQLAEVKGEVNEEVGEEINNEVKEDIDTNTDINIEENPEVDECNVIININHWFNYCDDELTEILGEKELFPEENIEKENINIDFDDTEYKKIMDDIKLLLSQNVTDKFDNILLLLKNELHEINQYLNKEEIKSIYDELYSKFKSYLNNMNNIKDKLGSISEELNKISLEEGGILNDIKSSGNFYYDIDLYINEIKQIFKEIDKILDNENKNNSNSMKDTLSYDFEKLKSSLNDVLSDILVSNIEDKKTIFNGLIKDFDKIILNSKNDYLDNEINRLNDIVKQKTRDHNIVVKPLSVNNEITPLVKDIDVDNTSLLYQNNTDEVDVDELLLSLDSRINKMGVGVSDVIDKFKNLSRNTENNMITNSTLNKVQELKNKYTNKKQMFVGHDVKVSHEDDLYDKYQESAKKSKALQEEISVLKGKLIESKERRSRENKNYMNDLNKTREAEEYREKVKDSSSSSSSSSSSKNVVNFIKEEIILDKSKQKPKSKQKIAPKLYDLNNKKNINDDDFYGELRTMHSISINTVNNIEIKDENIILIKDYKNENKNIENVSFNVNEDRVTYLRVDYDNKKVAKSFEYTISDETIKEKMKEIKGKKEEERIIKEKVKGDIINIINKINEVYKK